MKTRCLKSVGLAEDFYNFVVSRIDGVNNNICLLKSKEVIMYLTGDTSFLPQIVETKNETLNNMKRKKLEDEWGRNILKTRRPDLNLEKQWTCKFGEHICEEFLILLGKDFSKPKAKKRLMPDIETSDCIWEVKTQTFFTTGTAAEKILGTPSKYAEVPRLYSKPLKIICIAGAEEKCKKEFGVLNYEACPNELKMIIDVYEKIGITFVAATDLMEKIILS